MRIRLPEERKVRIEMLPLIDIVFLLLVFFIYAMLSMAVHHGMPVELPASEAAAIDRQRFVSVTVNAPRPGAPSGLIYVDEEAVVLADLTRVLRERAQDAAGRGSPEPGVLLFADRDLEYQKLFAVLDRISMAGLYRISLQADLVQ